MSLFCVSLSVLVFRQDREREMPFVLRTEVTPLFGFRNSLRGEVAQEEDGICGDLRRKVLRVSILSVDIKVIITVHIKEGGGPSPRSAYIEQEEEDSVRPQLGSSVQTEQETGRTLTPTLQSPSQALGASLCGIRWWF